MLCAHVGAAGPRQLPQLMQGNLAAPKMTIAHDKLMLMC